ncbi:heavy metal-binding domain-containing protein [Spirochaetia bacterium]|nr:heavy metal-binding domain-containing protein [Spirochaetia bacterium]
MESGIKVRTVHIDGMTCVNCQNKIERTLKNTLGIEDAVVSYNTGTAVITYNTETITIQEITSIIENLDYTVRSDTVPADTNRNMGILVIIIALFVLIQHFGLTGIFNAFPLVETGMGYGMIFIIGIITSVHCIAMCGGINLSQCIPRDAAGKGASISGGKNAATLRPSLLYNAGRVISYTAIGTLVGALGQVVSFSGWMRGLIQLAAGVFMIIMGINMLGIFPALRKFTPRLPAVFANKIEQEKGRSNSPLYVGLLNGLMPCGPLQAMQLYALSTGSPLRGGLSMLLFSLGTVPLMFGLGALSSVLSKKFTRKVMTVGAALVVVLGMSMFSYGWNLSGFTLPQLSSGTSAGNSGAVVENGIQLVSTTLASGRYQPIVVQAGIPVSWTIDAPAGSINGCNNRMLIPEYGIEHTFTTGANVVSFTPAKTGTFRYSCWMGMIRSTITVVEPGAEVSAQPASAFYDTPWDDEITEPLAAGFRIPTAELAIGVIETGAGTQRITIELTDQGFSPAALILQAGVQTEWIINNDSRRAENFEALFPIYGQKLSFTNGENIIFLYPQDDFEFSTSDSEYYGFVKVVDDIATMDIEALRTEISNHETMLYPASYFPSPDGGMGCCN